MAPAIRDDLIRLSQRRFSSRLMGTRVYAGKRGVDLPRFGQLGNPDFSRNALFLNEGRTTRASGGVARWARALSRVVSPRGIFMAVACAHRVDQRGLLGVVDLANAGRRRGGRSATRGNRILASAPRKPREASCRRGESGQAPGFCGFFLTPHDLRGIRYRLGRLVSSLGKGESCSTARARSRRRCTLRGPSTGSK